MADKALTPRTVFERNCDYCGQVYTAFRITSKFCGRDCRTMDWQERHYTFRAEVLERDGHRCTECGSCEGRLFVRALPGVKKSAATAQTYCGRCNSALSIRLFREREPDAAPGRNYRANISRKTEQQALSEP